MQIMEFFGALEVLLSKLDAFRTLMLDSGCRPMCAIPWTRGLTLDLADRVDVLEYYDQVVRTAHDEWPLPAVVRVRQYLRIRNRTVALTRRNLILRDGGCCQYCGCSPTGRELTMDHVIPRSKNGPTTWENVVLACGPCNRRKGARLPAQARMSLAVPPRKPTFLATSHRALVVTEPPEEWQAYLNAA